jgi:hypothetical protein
MVRANQSIQSNMFETKKKQAKLNQYRHFNILVSFLRILRFEKVIDPVFPGIVDK